MYTKKELNLIMAETKNIEANTSFKRLGAIVTNEVGNYEKHLFFCKKSE
jgi:hypothetical protein